MKRDRKYLFFVGIIPFILDISVTLYGQGSSYWAGDFSKANEAHHIGASLLSFHPLAFASASILYAGIILVIIHRAPRIIAWWFSIALLLAHTGGAKSWIPKIASWEYYSIWESTLNWGMAALATFCYLKAGKMANQNLDPAVLKRSANNPARDNKVVQTPGESGNE
jgi:hypothetical protein